MSVLDAPVGAAPGRAANENLVPVFVRLKLTLLRNGLRQSAGGGPRTSPPSSSPCCSPRAS